MSARNFIKTLRPWVGPILLTLVLLEGTLRVYQKITRGTPITAWFVGYTQARFPLSPFLVFGPYVDQRIEDKRYPDLSQYNHQGFRTPEEVGPKRPGEYRIIAVGGSTTMDGLDETGLHWPLVLECGLRDLGHPEIRVLNAGMAAYATPHAIVRLEFDLLDYEPDLVLVMHTVNDVTVGYYAHRDDVPVDGHYRVKYGLDPYTHEIRNDDVVLSRLWWSVKSRLIDLATPAPSALRGYDLTLGEEIFRRNLETISTLARARGTGILYLTEPYAAAWVSEHAGALDEPGVVDLPDEASFARDMDRFNTAVLETASSTGMGALDMARLMGGERRYFLDAVHYNTDGTLRFGRLLAAELAPTLPTPTEPPPPLTEAALARCAWQGDFEGS